MNNWEFKKTTMETATGTSLNKRFDGQNNSCARAFVNFFASSEKNIKWSKFALSGEREGGRLIFFLIYISNLSLCYTFSVGIDFTVTNKLETLEYCEYRR